MRRILGLLAAAILGVGLLGTAPTSSATSDLPTAAASPGHDHEDGYKYSHPHGHGHGTRHHDRNFHDDDDHDDHDDHDGHGRRRRCEGLIVVCLV